MVPDNLVRGVKNHRVGVDRGVALAGRFKHAQVIVPVAERDHVINPELFSQIVDPVAFAAKAVVNIDPVQSGFFGRMLPYFPLVNRNA